MHGEVGEESEEMFDPGLKSGGFGQRIGHHALLRLFFVRRTRLA